MKNLSASAAEGRQDTCVSFVQTDSVIGSPIDQFTEQNSPRPQQMLEMSLLLCMHSLHLHKMFTFVH
jgi:hypothetical protein